MEGLGHKVHTWQELAGARGSRQSKAVHAAGRHLDVRHGKLQVVPGSQELERFVSMRGLVDLEALVQKGFDSTADCQQNQATPCDTLRGAIEQRNDAAQVSNRHMTDEGDSDRVSAQLQPQGVVITQQMSTAAPIMADGIVRATIACSVMAGCSFGDELRLEQIVPVVTR